MANNELKQLINKLFKKEVTYALKEYLRFHPDKESDIMRIFAGKLQEISKKARAEGAVSVAAVQSIFKESYRKRSKATQYYPAWVDWVPIVDGMNALLDYMLPILRSGGGAEFGDVLMAFFRGANEHYVTYNQPDENDYNDVASTCRFAGMALVEWAQKSKAALQQKREYIQEIKALDFAPFYQYLENNLLSRIAASMQKMLKE
ncbi:MAG: hypothetical protein IJ993_05845 [Akkermansia sp.]|nr:hypothetical protein [Akkermansia sp.]